MNQILEFSEISLFYKSVDDLFKSILLKYPFTKMLLRVFSLTFFKILLNNIHELNYKYFLKLILNRINIKQPIILKMQEIQTGYTQSRSILLEPKILQFLKILEEKLYEKKITGRIEAISLPVYDIKYQNYIDENGGSLLFPNNLYRKDIGNGLLVSTKIITKEIQIKQDLNQFKEWVIEIESMDDNFNPVDFLSKLSDDFKINNNNYYSKIDNKAYLYIGRKKTDDFDNKTVMEFIYSEMPNGYDLLKFHDTELVRKIKEYTDPFIKKYIEYELHKNKDKNFKDINFSLSICIIGEPGSGKTQLSRSIVKYLEERIGIKLISIWTGIDSIKSIRDGISLFITREIDGRKYGNKAVLIFDNLDNENSILHNTMNCEEVINTEKGIISKKNKPELSHYIKTIMDSPLSPPGNINIYNCTPNMIDGINPEFERRMGLKLTLKPHTYNKK